MHPKISLNPQELSKFKIVKKVAAKRLKAGAAARMLGISPRQIQRLVWTVKRLGPIACVHGLKGRAGNRRIDEETKTEILKTIKEKYGDFKPTLASEMLKERDKIEINPETLRLWLIAQGMWKPRCRKKGEYCSWRPRKEYFGELVQFDGSYHLWFENRFLDDEGKPVEVCLLAAIDDATGKINHAEFADNEGAEAVFRFWWHYLEVLGIPLAIYLDSFSTYKVNYTKAEDNYDLITQFGRAMKTLGANLIFARSPEAKGRVERLFETLQDRLVKEMRIEGINNPQDGNRFLREAFIKKFNSRFSVIPAKAGNVHRALEPGLRECFNRIFSIQSARTINNDYTIQFKSEWFQLEEVQPVTVRPKEKVIVEKWIDHTIHFSLRGGYLNFRKLPAKPIKSKVNPVILTTHRLNWIPPRNHPWRQYPNKSR